MKGKKIQSPLIFVCEQNFATEFFVFFFATEFFEKHIYVTKKNCEQNFVTEFFGKNSKNSVASDLLPLRSAHVLMIFGHVIRILGVLRGHSGS